MLFDNGECIYYDNRFETVNERYYNGGFCMHYKTATRNASP
jgi:hypothetical protein